MSGNADDGAVLAYVCEHIDEVRQDLAEAALDQGAGATVLLEELDVAFAAGRPVGAILDAIHAVLLDAGDVLGLYGRFDPDHRGQPSGLTLTGLVIGPPEADEIVLLCPSGRCRRSSWRTQGHVPRCAFTDQVLREDRL